MVAEDILQAHRQAVDAEDWEAVRELEAHLVEPTVNTDRPEDGPQPEHHPVGEFE